MFHRPAENVCLCLFLLGNVEQFDFKDQHLIRSDEFSCSALAVGEGGGNEEFVFAADLHQLKSFRPAGNDAVDREGRRLAALNGAVEDGAVGKGARVVDRDHAPGVGLAPVPCLRTLY